MPQPTTAPTADHALPAPRTPPAHPQDAIAPGDWRRLLVVMEKLAASSDLDEVLGLIIDALRDLLDAERASVFQYDKPNHELFATRGHGVDRSLRFSADLGIAGAAVKSKSIINIGDCYADARFNRDIDRQTGFRTRCMLTIPLVSFDGLLEGVAQVLNKRPDPAAVQPSPTTAEGNPAPTTTAAPHTTFSDADESVARALASQAAVAMRRAKLIEAERRKTKIEADLRVARQVQVASLPSVIPTVHGYDIAALNRQAEETGGDTYDLVPLADGGILILMADATGHGVGPALSVTQAQAMLRMAAHLNAPLEQAVRSVNNLITANLPGGRFITAFIARFDPAAHRLRYISAGQAPILILRADGTNHEFDSTMFPLGLEADADIPPAVEVTFAPGDLLALLSDGFYEYRNRRKQLLGLAGVVRAVRAGMADEPGAAAVLRRLDEALREHGDGLPAEDDQTAILIRRLPA